MKEAWNFKRNWGSLFTESEFSPLDGFRAWAVTWVIIYHYLNYYVDVNPDQSDEAK